MRLMLKSKRLIENFQRNITLIWTMNQGLKKNSKKSMKLTKFWVIRKRKLNTTNSERLATKDLVAAVPVVTATLAVSVTSAALAALKTFSVHSLAGAVLVARMLRVKVGICNMKCTWPLKKESLVRRPKLNIIAKLSARTVMVRVLSPEHHRLHVQNVMDGELFRLNGKRRLVAWWPNKNVMFVTEPEKKLRKNVQHVTELAG